MASSTPDAEFGRFFVLTKTLTYCSAKCKFFRCGQRALTFNRRMAYCRWADDKCTDGTCNYAICIKSKLLPNGVCGLAIKRKTYEDSDPEIFEEPKIKIKGKLLRRFKVEDII